MPKQLRAVQLGTEQPRPARISARMVLISALGLGLAAGTALSPRLAAAQEFCDNPRAVCARMLPDACSGGGGGGDCSGPREAFNSCLAAAETVCGKPVEEALSDPSETTSADDKLFSEVVSADNKAAYEYYLQIFPTGKHAADVRERLSRLGGGSVAGGFASGGDARESATARTDPARSGFAARLPLTRARIIKRGSLCSTARFSEAQRGRLERQGLSGSDIDELVAAAREGAWPSGIQTLSGRGRLENEFPNYTVYEVRNFNEGEKCGILLYVPASENAHMPAEMRPTSDIFFRFDEGGVAPF